MIHLMEALFDVAYLGLVIALGMRLFLEYGKEAKKFGIMTMILGFGDAFHLLPRIIANLTVNGFEKYVSLLSWGEFITSITMTLFYVLFYHYYRTVSGDGHKAKSIWIYMLAGIRFILLFLSQNLWGITGNYIFGMIRNIPFIIMGISFIIWCWKYRKKDGLKNTSVLIAMSFLFYLPVVLGARFMPMLGIFMIPKKIVYILLIMIGFKFFIKSFRLENLLKDSLVFLLLGLISGVFYREFTKIYSWNTDTTLNISHTHLITLGFILFLILYSIMQNEEKRIHDIKIPLLVYIIGFSWMIVSFIVRGVYNITACGVSLFPDVALSGIAGIGHGIMGVGIVWLMIKVIKIKSEKDILGC